MTPACVSDYRREARRALPRFLFDYIDGGAGAETTLRRNLADLEAVPLRQRVLRDVSALDLSTMLLGRRQSLPVALGPIGLAGLCARRGEVQAARAAAAADIPFCLSTVSICPLREVAAAAARPIWFQLYMIRDRGFMHALLEQAAGLGCTTLLFTVDLPVHGARYRDMRSGLAGPAGPGRTARRLAQIALRPGWAWRVGLLGRPHVLGNVVPALQGKSGIEDFLGWIGRNFDPALSWDDLDFIRRHWPGTLVLKGILDPQDAREAVARGAEGIVVSNHGGRQLDGAVSTARALPAIAEAVGGRLAVLADGGVRSGLDVARLLALGADCVLLGRAWVYALAARGGPGVAHVLALIEAELRVAMALTGVTRISAIDRSILAPLNRSAGERRESWMAAGAMWCRSSPTSMPGSANAEATYRWPGR